MVIKSQHGIQIHKNFKGIFIESLNAKKRYKMKGKIEKRIVIMNDKGNAQDFKSSICKVGVKS